MNFDDEAIDAALRRLGGAPVHPALAGSSAVVLKHLSARRDAGRSTRLGSVAAVAALAMGLAAAGIPAAPVEATPALAVFGPSPPLAPSTLLTGGGG